MRQLPNLQHTCPEDGTLAEWLYEVPSPYAQEVAVVAESWGAKDDQRDASGLADQLRMGAIKRKVYKQRGQFRALGSEFPGIESGVPPPLREGATLESPSPPRSPSSWVVETTDAGPQDNADLGVGKVRLDSLPHRSTIVQVRPDGTGAKKNGPRSVG